MNAWWTMGFLIALSLFSGGIGWHLKGNNCIIAGDKIQKAQDIAVINAESGVISTERENEAKTKEVSNDYQNHLYAINTRYDSILDGLRSYTAQPDSLPGISSAIPGHHDCPRANGLSKRDKAAIIALAKRAEIQTARLISCQSWIAAQRRH